MKLAIWGAEWVSRVQPAGSRTWVREMATVGTSCSGFQPISWAALMAWAAKRAELMLKKTLAPLFVRFAICELMVGSLTS